MKKFCVQQGEVNIKRIDAIPTCETKKVERHAKGYIISHSESGHHHLLTDGDVMERTSGVPSGMQIFYAILDAPQEFVQDASNAHKPVKLDPGIYAFRVSREFNPFTEQAQRVAD